MFRSYKDMMGRMVEIKSPPGRIVSVVPSQTELLYDLGLEDEVVGITKFCVHPDSWFRNKTRVGGTKQLHLDKIGELQPDLIIANKEENTREQIEALAAEFPVWISDIKTVDQGVEMIAMIGEITGRETEAANIINEIRSGFENLRINPVGKKVAYFIWYRPWMAAGCQR